MNQEEISKLPGAYEVAFCNSEREPISPWLWMAPRTMFDSEIVSSFISQKDVCIAGVIGRNGEYRRIGPYAMLAGSEFKFTAGTKAHQNFGLRP